MKKICWLATGGTIASRPSENGLVPGFTAKEMLEMVPNLKDYGHINFQYNLRYIANLLVVDLCYLTA